MLIRKSFAPMLHIILILSLFIPVNIYSNYYSAAIQSIDKTLIKVTEAEALTIAEKYYGKTRNKVESDLINEFNAAITSPPLFNGSSIDSNLCRTYSVKTAASISYTKAKNYYLALASAVFSYNPKSAVAASNLAVAISTYYDDLLLENRSNKKYEKDYTSDAFKIFCYAAALTSKGNEFNTGSINILNCLGNLLLDMKKFDDAFTVFSTAHSIDQGNYAAITGMYNCYIAKKQYDKAFKLISEHSQFAPVFTRTISKIGKQFPSEAPEAGGNEKSDAEAENDIELCDKVPVVSTADFIEEIDPGTAGKIRKDIKSIQDKMVIKAPDIDYLLAIKNYENMSREFGQSALFALADQMKELGLETVGYETEALVKNQMALLKQFGVDIDSNIDLDNIQKLINDAIKNPGKYENFNPKVKVSGIDGIMAKAKQYQKKVSSAVKEAKRGNNSDLFEQLAKTKPEFKIMTVNPYLFANPNDILIQRFNVIALNKKKTTYHSYLKRINSKAGEIITDVIVKYNSKVFPLMTEYNNKLQAINDSDMDSDKKAVKIHRLHTEYFPRFNNIGRPYWNQATEAAGVAYKKIEKYSSRLYKECMKHVMMISDFEIREKLEEDITGNLITDIKIAMNNSLTAYSCAPYFDAALCDCDLEEIRALKEKIEEERTKLANAQILKNMADKKNFDQGVLDENSEYYKEYIAKYEYEVNLIFLKDKVSPYKSKFEVGLDLSMFGFNFSTVSNHLRNTTTYDGGISFGGGVTDAGSIKSGFGFTAVKGSNGLFSPKDIDVRASVEGSVNLGVVSLIGGVEASALRGTREYAQAGLTSDKYLDDFKKKEKMEWVPGIGKEVWTGSYGPNN